jgi:hypothetical protein
VLGIPNIIAFLTKQDLDAESKSLSASLLISIGNAGPLYISFARNHGIFESLCNWAQSTDNERHHFQIQVRAFFALSFRSDPILNHTFGFSFATFMRHLQNCLQLFAHQSSSSQASNDHEGDAVLSLLHV